MIKEITYDLIEDSAYIYFQEDKKISGIISRTYTCNPIENGGMINIDFTDDGKIFGIELIPASLYLGDGLLDKISKLSD